MEAQVSNICLRIQNLQKRKGVGQTLVTWTGLLWRDC